MKVSDSGSGDGSGVIPGLSSTRGLGEALERSTLLEVELAFPSNQDSLALDSTRHVVLAMVECSDRGSDRLIGEHLRTSRELAEDDPAVVLIRGHTRLGRLYLGRLGEAE